MDAIRAALGYETSTHADKQTTGDQLGEIASGNHETGSSGSLGGQAPQHASGNANSGTEPISGQLGSGTAGQPYDAGNQEGLAGYTGNSSSTGTSGLASGLTGHSSRGTGYEGTSGTGGNNTSGSGSNSTLSGLASSLTGNSQNTSGYGNNSSTTGSGLTGNSQTNSGYDNNSSTIGSGLGNSQTTSGYGNTAARDNDSTLSGVASGVASGLTGHSNRGQGYENTSGLGGNSAPTVGSGNYGSSNSGYSGSSIPNPEVAGYESTSGYGNNTGYEQSTSRGLGVGTEQQANHYTSTAVAGKLPSALGMDAVHQVGGTSDRDFNVHHGHHHGTHGRESNLGQGHDQGYGQDSTYGRGNTHGSTDDAIHQDTSSGYGRSLLGSDRGAGTTGDRYLFNEHTAPGGGGRHRGIVDDFTDANIHHEGAGGISEGVGSDANAGKATAGAANTDISSNNTGSNSGLESNRGNERARKPGFGRVGSNIGTSNYGLNSGVSGAPRESIGQKLENKAEKYAPAAGLAGAGAAGYDPTRHHHSGTEPLSGQRGSGVAGEPYDQGNNYDGTGLTGREAQYGAGSGYGHDGVSQATSGVSGLNLRDGQSDTDRNGAYGNSSSTVLTPDGLPYPGRNQNTQRSSLNNSSDNFSRSQDAGLTGAGVAGTGAAASGLGGNHHHHHHHDKSGTSSYDAGLEERFAGAPPVDDCEGSHHTAHPTGVDAHVDGTHKPTFLDYRNDEFGIPVARDDEAAGLNNRV